MIDRRAFLATLAAAPFLQTAPADPLAFLQPADKPPLNPTSGSITILYGTDAQQLLLTWDTAFVYRGYLPFMPRPMPATWAGWNGHVKAALIRNELIVLAENALGLHERFTFVRDQGLRTWWRSTVL
jgi:hypothetical protein